MAIPFLAQRQSALVAQEQLAVDPFLEAVDPSHQRRTGEAEYLGSVPETLVSRANQERLQVVPGRIRRLVRSVLRHRSTPMQ